MNPSVNDPDEGVTDRLLFEYLEGELSPERAKALESRLAADPALRSELELWQASFVEPDLYDTQALEKGLVKEHVNVPGSWAAGWLLGLVLVAALFLLAPPAVEKEPAVVRERVAPTAAPVRSGPAEEKAASTEQPVPAAAPQTPELRPNAGSNNSPGRTVREAHFSQKERTEATQMPEIRPLTPVLAPENAPVAADLSARQIKVRPVPVKKAALPKALSRKQQRAIARMKERARQQRKANEFLKGNVPYVVPLNPNSF